MKKYFHIHDNTRLWLGVSGGLVLLSIVLLFTLGLKFGLDFTGGTLMRIKFSNNIEKTALTEFVNSEFSSSQIISLGGENEWNIKTKTLTSDEHNLFKDNLTAKFGELEESGMMSIGPVVSKSLRTKALTALLIALVAMIAYISLEFRKLPTYLTSWKFGVVAVVALFHDVLIIIGIFVLLGYFLGIEVDTFFVTALLTILGYSVNDTIVIFDKIREESFRSKKSFKEVAEESVWSTMGRSINTSMTLLIALLSLLFFGPESLRYFVLALVIGAVVGTYSSIFVASPLLVLWHKDVQR